jgi:hypothetical protein
MPGVFFTGSSRPQDGQLLLVERVRSTEMTGPTSSGPYPAFSGPGRSGVDESARAEADSILMNGRNVASEVDALAALARARRREAGMRDANSR